MLIFSMNSSKVNNFLDMNFIKLKFILICEEIRSLNWCDNVKAIFLFVQMEN